MLISGFSSIDFGDKLSFSFAVFNIFGKIIYWQKHRLAKSLFTNQGYQLSPAAMLDYSVLPEK